MSLWIELHLAYEQAVEVPGRSATLDEIWSLVRWCRDDYRNDDMWNAVTVAFLEHLLDHRSVREDLPKRISRLEAETWVPHCAYFHPAEEIERYLEWFRAVQRGETVQSFRFGSNG